MKKTLISAILFGLMHSASAEIAFSDSIGTTSELVSQSKTDLSQVYYVNVNSDISASHILAIKTALEDGQVILIDASNTSNTDSIVEVSKLVTGLGLRSDALVAYKDQNTGKINYSLIEKENFDIVLDKTLNQYNQMLQKTAKSSVRSLREANEVSEDFTPVYSYTVQTYKPLSCDLKSKLKHYTLRNDSIKNVCDQDAAIDLIYNVDLVRSIPVANAQGVLNEDKKYVRISILENEGGTGIHLVDSLEETKTWKQTHAYQDFFFGPFAEKYAFSIDATDQDVDLLGHIPSQVNPKQTKTFSNTLSIGFEVGAFGGFPMVGVDGALNGSYSTTESVTVETNEYTLTNDTNGNKAAWSWDINYEDNSCSWLRKRDFGRQCYFSTNFFDYSNAVLKQEPVSAMGYKNFTPSFSAIYYTEPNKTGESEFVLNARVDYMGIGTKLIPAFPAIRGSIKDKSRNHDELSTSLIVDWSHPYFSAEPVYSIQDISKDNACLTRSQSILSYSDHASIETSLKTCQSDIEDYKQLFGYSLFNNQIMTIDPNSEKFCLYNENGTDTVVLDVCSSSMSQKWKIDEEGRVQNMFTGNYLTMDADKLATTDIEANATKYRFNLKK